MKGGRVKLLAPATSESAATIVSHQVLAVGQVVSQGKWLRFRPSREVVSAQSSGNAPVAASGAFSAEHSWCNVRHSVHSDMA